MNAKRLHAFCFAAFILLIGAVHYAAFYRSMADHQFNSDAFAPFIEEVHSAGGLLHNLTSVDSLFEYRPIPTGTPDDRKVLLCELLELALDALDVA